MVVTLAGVVTFLKASPRAVSCFASDAPGETLDPVLPDPAMAALGVVLPLEGIALEHDSVGGPVAWRWCFFPARSPLGVVAMMLGLLRRGWSLSFDDG